MKKVLSVMMAVAMLFTCLVMSTGAMAADVPELKVGSSVTITAPKKGTSENEVKVAKFVPAKSGSYVFECTTAYKNVSGTEELPGGAMGVNEDTEGNPTQGFCFFMDTSSLSKEVIDSYKAMGMDVELLNIPKFTADLEANKTYYVTIYQDGGNDYVTELTVEEHTHTLKKNQEEKVAVKKDGTSEDVGGIYDTCEDWFCAYLNYTTVYKQIEKTTVKAAEYTGKEVAPAVVIRTTDGKKLDSKYYTVAFKNNKKIGKGKAIITFRNGYTGTVKKSFKINPKATTVKKAKASGNKVKVRYKKVAHVSGYQVQVASNKKFTKNKKSYTIKGAKKTTVKVNGVKGYVRVRTYKVVNGKKYYSAWSKAIKS